MDENILMPVIMRVTIEYGDRIQTVEGTEAEKFGNILSTTAIIAAQHGYIAPRLDWQIIKKETPILSSQN
jgi:hypothetical protein